MKHSQLVRGSSPAGLPPSFRGSLLSLALLVLLSLAACTESVTAVPQRYARAVLEHADAAAADALSENPGSLAVRSQVAFLKGHGELQYKSSDATHFTIARLVVAGQEYSGDFTVELSSDGQKVKNAVLRLRRQDGTALAL